MCVCTYNSMHVEAREQLGEPVLSYCMVLRIELRKSRVGAKCPYLRSYFTSYEICFETGFHHVALTGLEFTV